MCNTYSITEIRQLFRISRNITYPYQGHARNQRGSVFKAFDERYIILMYQVWTQKVLLWVLPRGLKPYCTLYPFIPCSHVQSWVVRLENIMCNRYFNRLLTGILVSEIRKIIRPLQQWCPTKHHAHANTNLEATLCMSLHILWTPIAPADIHIFHKLTVLLLI